MDNFWRTLLWIMAGFSALFGAGMMWLSVSGGTVSVLGAALMLPPVSNGIGRWMRIMWAPPIAGFIIAMMAGPIITFMTAPSLEEILARAGA